MLEKLKELEIERRIKQDKIILDLETKIGEICQKHDCTKETSETILNKKLSNYKTQLELLYKKQERSLMNRIYHNPNSKISRNIQELSSKVSDLESIIRNITGLINDISKRRLEIWDDVMSLKNIQELGISFKEGVEILKSHNIPLVLDAGDKKPILNPEVYDGLHNFALVHKTNYLPSDSVIKTSAATSAKLKSSYAYKQDSQLKEFEYDYFNKRDTVHFSVNGEVRNHVNGQWDQCKYAIIVPMELVSLDRFTKHAVQDTYAAGNFKLPAGSYLLCPVNEKEEAMKKNPNINIVAYSGENVLGYATSLLEMLGYSSKNINDHSWGENKQNQGAKKQATKYYDLLATIKPDIDFSPHFLDFDYLKETWLTDVSDYTAFIGKLIDEEIKVPEDELKRLINLKDVYSHLLDNEKFDLNLQLQVLEEFQNSLAIRNLGFNEEEFKFLLEQVKPSSSEEVVLLNQRFKELLFSKLKGKLSYFQEQEIEINKGRLENIPQL